ncbi:MAG: hypothetical protein FWD14_06760 [Treponema sp.]|nr:hypothetical protein [Treponema sp.]
MKKKPDPQMISNNPHKLRKRDFFVIIIFLFFALVSLELFRRDLLQTFKLKNVEPVGTVVVKRNTVQRRLGDRVLWDRLARESPVYVWDLIRVADISAATLYIDDNSIDLGENTIIRIVPSPDGIGVMIVMSSGSLSLAAGNESIILDLNGRQIRSEPGAALNAYIAENGELFVQEYGSIAQLIQEGAGRNVSGTQLISPSINSTIRYNESMPMLNFSWTEVEEAVSYVIQISDNVDFLNPQFQMNSSVNYIAVSGIRDGLWYWRVKPVLPSVFGSQSFFTTPYFFSVEQTNTDLQELSLSDWLVLEMPSSQVPYGVPPELIPAAFTASPPPVIAAVPAPVPAPPAARPTARPAVPQAAPQLLPAPRNMQPVNGTSFGITQLQNQRTIVFNWSPVQGANAYIFILYNQTDNGRLQVVRSTINRGASYTLDNLRMLDRGSFVWQVEPIRQGRGNAIEQRGMIGESSFVIDFPSPGPVHIEETGILYGN